MLPLFLASCAATNNLKLYNDAVKTSMYPYSLPADTALIGLTAANKDLVHKQIEGEDYILMVTWKAKDYYPDSGVYENGNFEIWVTAAPELRQRMAGQHLKDTSMRIRQLLGLPPEAGNKLFVEFWVRPNDMFRPCPDKEVGDNRCNLCYTHSDSADANHLRWMDANRLSRYYQCNLQQRYPWTQLGYTYDWNPANKTHIGLCEFVVQPHSRIYVNRKYSTTAYLSLGKP